MSYSYKRIGSRIYMSEWGTRDPRSGPMLMLMLLRQLSYAIKNQLNSRHPKPRTGGFGKKYPHWRVFLDFLADN